MAEEVKVTYLTQQGYDEKKQYLEYLKGEKRQTIIDKINEARGHGDLSENSEYDEARDSQSKNEAEIVVLEEQLKHVVIIQEADLKTDIIRMGHYVTVKDNATGEVFEVNIVGSLEADPFENKISNECSLGKALLGRAAGDTVEVETLGGKDSYEVIKIVAKYTK